MLIPFSEYMRDSLYGANGYYMAPHRVGKGGDFYTSVSASKFFGGAIANYILSLLESSALHLPLRIVEFGADKGYLLGDIALFLDALSQNVLESSEFIIIEPLPSLAKVQRAHFSSLSTKINFNIFSNVASMPSPSVNTHLFIITNELFDSVPCDILKQGQIFCIQKQSDSLWRGAWQNLDSVRMPQPTCDMLDILGLDKSAHSGIVPHWLLLMQDIEHIAKMHKSAYFLSFDYGDRALLKPSLEHIRLYFKHSVMNLQNFLNSTQLSGANKREVGNFYDIFKNTDITYDVDFSLLERLFGIFHFKQIFCDRQERILIEQMKLLELLELFLQNTHFSAYRAEIAKVRSLLHQLGGHFFGMCYKYE